jgi:hypothetical protein
MIDIQKLKALAEAATPGKWSTSGSYVAPTRKEGGTTYVENWRSIALVSDDADRAFIAAANPAAVLELIERIERLESAKATLDRLGYIDNGGQLWKPPLGKKPDFALIDQLKAENEALREALTTIREESHDIGACECAADALVDSRKELRHD